MGPSIREAVLGLRREYACLPGLRLTAAQVQRLFGMDAFRSEAVLGALLDAGVLERTSDGQFVRRPAAPDSRSGRLGLRRRQGPRRRAA